MSEAIDSGLAIDVKSLTRIFPGHVTALAGLDLEVKYGDMVAITGPSGCGKSTLLNILAAIDAPTSGSVIVAGRDLMHTHDLSGYRRHEVGLVFQLHNLLPHISTLSNVELPMFSMGWSAHQRKTRARQLLAEVDLSGCEHRLPTELSGGERQRVAIARALANKPRILLADEPTGSLDSASTTRFLDLLGRLEGGGMTIVMVTHAPEVAAHAHRVVEMRDGTVVGESIPDPAHLDVGDPLRSPAPPADSQDDRPIG